MASDPCRTCTISPGVAETIATKMGARNPKPNHITPSSAQMYAGKASPTVTISVKNAWTLHQRPMAYPMGRPIASTITSAIAVRWMLMTRFLTSSLFHTLHVPFSKGSLNSSTRNWTVSTGVGNLGLSEPASCHRRTRTRRDVQRAVRSASRNRTRGLRRSSDRRGAGASASVTPSITPCDMKVPSVAQ